MSHVEHPRPPCFGLEGVIHCPCMLERNAWRACLQARMYWLLRGWR